MNAKAEAVQSLSFPPISGMVNLDVMTGALIIMTRTENGNSEAACGLVEWKSMNMKTDQNELKARATRLQAATKAVLGSKCTLAQAYEMLAKEENFPSWDALSGVAKAAVAPSASSDRAPVDKALLDFSSCLVITGETGSGKSMLLDACKRVLNDRLFFIDPLSYPEKRWAKSMSKETITAVAYDHVFNLAHAASEIATSSEWCGVHRKLLILVEISIEDLKAIGVTLPREFTHIDMSEIKKYGNPQKVLFEPLLRLFGSDDAKRILGLIPHEFLMHRPIGDPGSWSSVGKQNKPSSRGRGKNKIDWARKPAGALIELIISRMECIDDPDGGSLSETWKGRAISLVAALARPLTYLRDKGEISLSPEVFIEYLDLNAIEKLVYKHNYGESFDKVIVAPLQAYLSALPDWQMAKLGNQEQKTMAQHGFIGMQLTRIFQDLSEAEFALLDLGQKPSMNGKTA